MIDKHKSAPPLVKPNLIRGNAMSAIRTFLIAVLTVLLLLPETQNCHAAHRLTMGAEKLIGTSSGTCINAALAYNRHNDEYLVAFEYQGSGGYGITVRRISTSGKFLGGFDFQPTSGSASKPDVVYNGINGEYLLVWEESNTAVAPTRYEIRGRVMPWNNLQANSSFWIATATDHFFKDPSVAWNSFRNEYMVVFAVYDFGASGLGISRRRLNHAGGQMSNMDFVIPGGGPQAVPDITYNLAADQYLVVWHQFMATGDRDVYGARLSYLAALQGSTIIVATETSDQGNPCVTTNEQNRCFVVWQELVLGDYDIRGQLFDIYGNPVGSRYYIAGTFDDETEPVAAANGATQEYLVTWNHQVTVNDREIQGKLYQGENRVAVQEFDIAPSTLGNHYTPAIGFHYKKSGRYGFFTTYERLVHGTFFLEIYGRILWAVSATPWIHMLIGSD